MASEREIFSNSGPADLTAVNWANPQHWRIVAASLVQGTYEMEHDRRQKLQRPQALDRRWWEFFNFQPVQVLVDEHDLSIFGAIFEFKFPPSSGNYLPPRYVVAFRGTITKTDTIKQDLKLDCQFIRSKLQQSTRVHLAMQAVQHRASIAGAANIWLAGHSLGSAIALVAGKNMVKMGCFIETYLFNPPFTSVPIFKNETLKDVISISTSFIKAGVVVARNSKHQRSQKNDSFKVLSGWKPHLFVNLSDPICSGYIRYFEIRQKLLALCFRNIARLATQNSLLSQILDASGKDSEPLHLLPSAYMTINVSPMQGFKEAHGIQQWWKQNINCVQGSHKW